MLSHENCEYFEQVVPFEDHEHGAKTFIRTNQKGKVTVNSNPGLGIEVDWEVINRDWYSYLKLDQNGLSSKTRSI
jgi:L-alanine-DL-glutamate epimerase-like enolase superfamily enzyme